MDLSVLEEIGLTKTEAKVYWALLQLGSASVGQISKKADVYRSNTYKALEKLLALGLASFIEKNKKFFIAENPKKLLSVLEEKRNFLIDALPEMEEAFTKPKVKQTARILEGKEGIKRVLKNILDEGEDFVALGAGKTVKVLPIYIDKFHKERTKLKMDLRAIMPNTPAAKQRAKHVKKLSQIKIKFLPEEFIFNTSIYIYSNKTAIFIWSKLNPLVFLIESNEVTKGFKKKFEILWKIASK